MIESGPAFKRNLKLMGNRFEFTALAASYVVADDAIDLAIAEVQRIEQKLTTFNDHSLTNQVNANAGLKPTVVDKEFLGIVERSIAISNLTQGAFDITYGGIDKDFWNFNVNLRTLPPAHLAKQAVKLIDYQKICIDWSNQTIMLKEKGMRIGFGGIAKGYAADMAKKKLLEVGIRSGIVNAAGDLITWGTQEDGRPWTVGIVDPSKRQGLLGALNISNKAVATSGDYEKFVIIGGKKYAHTIDPKTGFPVSGIKSVTIIAPHAELADALATPIMVMGVKVGLHLINQIKDIACIIVDDGDQLYTSKNINLT